MEKEGPRKTDYLNLSALLKLLFLFSMIHEFLVDNCNTSH